MSWAVKAIGRPRWVAPLAAQSACNCCFTTSVKCQQGLTGSTTLCMRAAERVAVPHARGARRAGAGRQVGAQQQQGRRDTVLPWQRRQAARPLLQVCSSSSCPLWGPSTGACLCACPAAQQALLRVVQHAQMKDCAEPDVHWRHCPAGDSRAVCVYVIAAAHAEV